MSSLHPKFSVSVYSEGHQFNKDPYDVNRGFAIYTIKKEEPTQTLTEKFKSTLTYTDWKEFYASKYRTPVKPSAASPSKYDQTESPLQSPDKTYELTSPRGQASKLKSKLEKDVERAEYYKRQGEEPQEEVQVKNHLSKSALVSPNKTTNSWGNATSQGFTTGLRTHGRSGTQRSFIKERTKSSALKKTLYYDPRTSSIPKSSLKNPVIDDLIDKEDFIMTNPALLQSIIKLRDMNLLKQNSPGVNKYKGVGKVDYVMNDFHSRSTNPGYSRNTGGIPYYR